MSGTSTSVANAPLGSYPVRRRETASGQIQVVSLDIGDGATESPVTSSNPLPVSLIGGDAEQRSLLSALATLLSCIYEAIKRPSYSTIVGGARLLKVSCDQMTTVSNVTTVSTITNVNGINSLDSRWLPMNQWNQNYRLGLRSRIN